MKYNEDEFLNEALNHIKSTYGDSNGLAHYVGSHNKDLQLVDLWALRGARSALETCINTAIKYLERYGRKGGFNKRDLYKAVHYITFINHFTAGVEAAENPKVEPLKIEEVDNIPCDDIPINTGCVYNIAEDGSLPKNEEQIYADVAKDYHTELVDGAKEILTKTSSTIFDGERPLIKRNHVLPDAIDLSNHRCWCGVYHHYTNTESETVNRFYNSYNSPRVDKPELAGIK